MKLTGNTIFITGGTSGLCRALAEAFHCKGNKVIVGGRRECLLSEVAYANPGIDTVLLDLADPDQIQSVAQELIAKYPDLNVIINNAGVMLSDGIVPTPDGADAITLVETNVMGPVRIGQAFLEHLKGSPEAYIINSTSVAAEIPEKLATLYSETKAAVHSYSKSQQLSLRDTSVRVLEITLPWMPTNIFFKSGEERTMLINSFTLQIMSHLEKATTEFNKGNAQASKGATRASDFDFAE